MYEIKKENNTITFIGIHHLLKELTKLGSHKGWEMLEYSVIDSWMNMKSPFSLVLVYWRKLFPVLEKTNISSIILRLVNNAAVKFCIYGDSHRGSQII